MTSTLRFLLAVLIPFLTCQGLTASGPENLVIVVNSQSPNSITIANHYGWLRRVPESNFIYLDSVPDKESIGIKEFRTAILEPIFKEIDARKIGNQIDIIAYSADFPTAIKLPKEAQDTVQPEKIRKYFRPTASINSVTFFAGQALRDDFSFIGPTANYYFRHASQQAMENFYAGELNSIYAELKKAYEDGDYESALESAHLAIEKQKGPAPVFRFKAAQCYAQLDQKTDALAMLDLAIEDGWNFSKPTLDSKAFAAMKNSEEFQARIKSMTEGNRVPPRTFQSKTVWSPNGYPTLDPRQGRRYLLSAMLGVARGKGNSVAEIVQSLESSLKSDGTKPNGTFYFVKNNGIRSKTRAPYFEEATEALSRLGKSAEIIGSALPNKKNDVIGLMAGASKLDWKKSKSTILPGAICEHLTSFGGKMAGEPGKGQTTLSEFIRHGAAGASGTVIEPFTFPHKFPLPMIHYYYARGCNLIESFYQSVNGPYQLLIVGDPLCSPFARIPEFEVNGISSGESIAGKISISIKAEKTEGITSYDLFYDDKFIKSLNADQTASFDSSNAPDGYHEFRVVAKTKGPIVFSNRKIIDFRIRNRAELPSPKTISKTQDFRGECLIELSAPGKFDLVALKNGRELKSKTIKNDQQSATGISVPCAQLGNGPSRVRVFATNGEKRLCLGVVTFQVEGPQP